MAGSWKIGFSLDMLSCAFYEMDTTGTKNRENRVELRIDDSNEGVEERIRCVVKSVRDPASRLPGLVLANRACLQISNPKVNYNQRLLTGVAVGGGFLPVHGAAVIGKRGALVFLGKSSAGKTTISTELLADLPLIHDDRIVVDPGAADEKPSVLGSRLLNPNGQRHTQDSIELAGLFILSKSNSSFLESISPSRSLYWLMSSRPKHVELNVESLLGVASDIVERVPVKSLSFNTSEDDVKRALSHFF